MGDGLATTADVAYDQWVIRFRAALIGALGALVAGIAAIAYLVSFEAISLFAMHSGGIAPKYAWAAPLLVDSFIAVATGADLWFAVGTSQRQWWELAWPKLLLAGAAAVSFILNVAHAKHTWAARGVAALAPAALLLSVELLMLVVRRAATLRALRFAVAQAATGPPPHAVGGTSSTTTDTDPPPTTDDQHPAAAVAGPGRRRPSAAQMQAARTAAETVFAEHHGQIKGPQLYTALRQRGHLVSERACFGLLRRLRDQPPDTAADPGRNGQHPNGQRTLRELLPPDAGSLTSPTGPRPHGDQPQGGEHERQR